MQKLLAEQEQARVSRNFAPFLRIWKPSTCGAVI